MDMDTGFFSWIISADISVPENFMDMDMDMPNFHGSYPWRALYPVQINSNLFFLLVSLSVASTVRPRYRLNPSVFIVEFIT